MKILVLNSGSSSLKFQLFMRADLSVLASTLIAQIGADTSAAKLSFVNSSGVEQKFQQSGLVTDHRAAIKVMGEMLQESETLAGMGELAGIGHRVVHGGEAFRHPVRIDETVIFFENGGRATLSN